ncbi:cadherin-17 [Sardina pilchardus]|uniref:cadherin-17 n=1 Tax=Sardina pilchardus TaxID=27697 RepID=UPI002E12F879
MMKHLLLLALLLSSSYGIALEDLKGPLENKALLVPETTTVPHNIYQFKSAAEGVTAYRVSGDLQGVSMSEDGWLYLTEPLAWSDRVPYSLQIEALAGDETVDGPYDVALTVVDMNNNAPTFEEDLYVAEVLEHTASGMTFMRVVASDTDDPNTANAALRYSIAKQIPITPTAMFQIDPQTGEISTTEDGAKLLKARAGLRYGRGEEHGSREVLEKKFDGFCSPTHDIPYEDNPFFTCVLRQESRGGNVPTSPDYTLIVKAEDMGGAQNALSGATRVDVVVRQNLWVNPGPITIKENLKEAYPMLIAEVTSNDPNAIYSLVQKERADFPFSINPDGMIYVTGELNREDKDMYTLVVLAKDGQGVEVEKPMEILVTVSDENDNAPMCGKDVFEVQENEPTGSLVGNLDAYDADDENTQNALLTYTLLSPSAEFIVEPLTGDMKVVKGGFRRSVAPEYSLTYSVSDGGVPAKTAECKITVKVIDINNELPLFEKNNYGKLPVPENAEPGTKLLTVKATDADDPGTGSSKVEYTIAGGDPDGVFTIQLDEATGEGTLTIAKPLDFEEHPTYTLQIHARNPEPLVKGLEYGEGSTAVVIVGVEDVDEAPVFDQDLLAVNVPENLTVGATVLNIKAHDPEGKEIIFELVGDERGWFAIDSSGELKTKKALDYEEVQHLTVKVIVSEKGAPDMKTEKEVDIHLNDVNDNVPKLVAARNYICVKDHKTPLIITAEDKDAEPFAGPFTFSLGTKGKRSPNWEVKQLDGNTAELTLKKIPPADQTFGVPINIKDNAGMGITHTFKVEVCNCTQFGSCFIEPLKLPGRLSLEETIGILGGVMGFIIIVLIVAVKRSKKKDKTPNTDEGETMMRE